MEGRSALLAPTTTPVGEVGDVGEQRRREREAKMEEKGDKMDGSELSILDRTVQILNVGWPLKHARIA